MTIYTVMYVINESLRLFASRKGTLVSLCDSDGSASQLPEGVYALVGVTITACF